MLRAVLLRSASGLRRSPMAAPLSTAAAAAWLSEGASSPPMVRLLIGGEFVESRADQHVDVTNPATQEVFSRIPLTTADEFRAAVDAARAAFPGWRNTPVMARQRIMFKFQELIRANMDKLAENITTEQGKTLKDAWGDVFRGARGGGACLWNGNTPNGRICICCRGGPHLNPAGLLEDYKG